MSAFLFEKGVISIGITRFTHRKTAGSVAVLST